MRTRLSTAALLAALLAAGAAQATTSFALAPSPLVSGLPGATVGWGFTLVNDEDFLVVSSAGFDGGGASGVFTDFISAANFFVVGNAPDGSTTWSQRFDATARTGVGRFVIDAAAQPGSLLIGMVTLTYDVYARSPLDPAFDPDVDTLALGRTVQAAASVAVGVVPEPAPWQALAAGLAVLAALWRRRRPAAR